MMERKDPWQNAARVIHQADAMLITAGAGMGVDSGLPDFRGNEGFWKAYPPMKALGLSFMSMANPQGFDHDPTLAWGFYGHRLNLYRQTIPHEGFALLRQWSQSKSMGSFVFTSNVDGQFQRAGFDAERVEECHGSIHHLQCTKPCHGSIWSAKTTLVEVDESTFRASQPLPSCPHCDGLARPNILMFGDGAWIDTRTFRQAQKRALWLEEVQSRKLRLVIIELGAGETVSTVRQFSQGIAQIHQARFVRINPRDAQVNSSHHLSLAVGACEGLQRLNMEMEAL